MGQALSTLINVVILALGGFLAYEYYECAQKVGSYDPTQVLVCTAEQTLNQVTSTVRSFLVDNFPWLTTVFPYLDDNEIPAPGGSYEQCKQKAAEDPGWMWDSQVGACVKHGGGQRDGDHKPTNDMMSCVASGRNNWSFPDADNPNLPKAGACCSKRSSQFECLPPE